MCSRFILLPILLAWGCAAQSPGANATDAPDTVAPPTFAPVPPTPTPLGDKPQQTESPADDTDMFPVHWRIVIVLVLVILVCACIVAFLYYRRPKWTDKQENEYDMSGYLMELQLQARASAPASSAPPATPSSQSPGSARAAQAQMQQAAPIPIPAELVISESDTTAIMSDSLPHARSRNGSRAVSSDYRRQAPRSRGRAPLTLEAPEDYDIYPPSASPTELTSRQFDSSGGRFPGDMSNASMVKPGGAALVRATSSGRQLSAFPSAGADGMPLTPVTPMSAKSRRPIGRGFADEPHEATDPDSLFSGSSRTLARGRQSMRGNVPARSLAMGNNSFTRGPHSPTSQRREVTGYDMERHTPDGGGPPEIANTEVV